MPVPPQCATRARLGCRLVRPELGVRTAPSTSTIRRGIEHLRDLGYRITMVKGPDGGYRLDAGAHLPPLLFDDDQAVALTTALRAAAAMGAANAEAALRALTTVRQVLPSRLRHRADSLTLTTLPSGAEAADPAVLLGVSSAVRASEVLRFDYVPVNRDPDAEPSRRRAEPHHVVFGNGRWYLLAGRFKGSDGENAWPCTGEAVVHLPAREVVPFVAEGTVVDLGPDRCRVTAGSWSWVALAASYARFDSAVTDAAPPELADAFALLSRRFAESGHPDEG